MARVNRSDVIQKAVNDLALSSSEDKIPNETLDKIQLTYDLNKRFSSWVNSISGTTSGSISLTLPTGSTGSEVYLTSISASYKKDSACDVSTARLLVTVTPAESGISSNILGLPTITLTAQDETQILSLAYPLKLKPGSTISMAGTFTMGVMTRSLHVTGFTTSSN